ncbi:MAG: hypothetical protein AAF804_17175 [Bacteroidota bacterium]
MKLAPTLTILLCFLALSCQPLKSAAQSASEAALHLRSIWGSTTQDSLFLEHMLRGLLKDSPDQSFVSNRELLRPLCVSSCARDSVVIHDTLQGGEWVTLRLTLGEFEPDSHLIEYAPGPDSLIEAIDDRPAFGAIDRLPESQISSMSLLIDEQEVLIPPSAFRCFYEVNLCGMEYFLQPAMSYPSLDENYLYLYLYGGQGAGTYLAKLVFDRDRYLTRIVAEYPLLQKAQAIRPDLVGF